MKVAVAGLFHLGSVTAACLANAGHEVIAYDPNQETIANLQKGQAPIFEPGLNDLLSSSATLGKLAFTTKPQDLSTADILWVSFDTPVDNNDVADVDYVMQEIQTLFSHLKNNTLVIMSSQIPVGTTQKLQAENQSIIATKNLIFAYIPENLRLGKAIEIFTKPDRIVIGLDDLSHKNLLETLLKPFSSNLIWMSVVSAEMTKHAINAFLAISVTFINELSTLCEIVGANGRDVELGLKSEERIGPKAYLRPGDSIAGGTLMRDINYLTQLGEQKNRDTFLLNAVLESNHYHKQWSCRKLTTLLQNLKGKRIAMLGLTYKAGTDTLRRSTAIETCEWLHQQGTLINAYDPSITKLPTELAQFIQIKSNVAEALHAADAVIISTAWPQFRDLSADEFANHLKQTFVLDPSGFIAKNLANDKRIQYFSVGVPS